MTRPTDGFGSLLEVIDKRMAQFGPDRTATLGYYFTDPADGVNKVLLDTGQLVPSPVITPGVSPGHRYPVIWMQDGHDVAVISVQTGIVWAITDAAFGDMHWASDGSAMSALLTPPDTDSYDGSDLGGSRAWYAGGSDGTFIYQIAVDHLGQWHVDKFNDSLTALLDRWTITGWTAAFGGNTFDPHFDIQHVTANAAFVVAMADVTSAALEHVFIDFAVFDLTGTLLHQWSHATPSLDEFDSRETIADRSGSCLDASHLYFVLSDNSTGSDWITSVLLSSGALTRLFTIDAVDSAISVSDPGFFGLISGRGLVEVEGDFIVAGSNGLARVQADGTPVWWGTVTDLSQSYIALAHSGRGSVYACFDTETMADEWNYDGTFVQTINITETARQAWLVGTP